MMVGCGVQKPSVNIKWFTILSYSLFLTAPDGGGGACRGLVFGGGGAIAPTQSAPKVLQLLLPPQLTFGASFFGTQ